jgi:hypothetical protein
MGRRGRNISTEAIVNVNVKIATMNEEIMFWVTCWRYLFFNAHMHAFMG